MRERYHSLLHCSYVLFTAAGSLGFNYDRNRDRQVGQWKGIPMAAVRNLLSGLPPDLPSNPPSLGARVLALSSAAGASPCSMQSPVPWPEWSVWARALPPASSRATRAAGAIGILVAGALFVRIDGSRVSGWDPEDKDAG
jgi:hypothetical protein